MSVGIPAPILEKLGIWDPLDKRSRRGARSTQGSWKKQSMTNSNYKQSQSDASYSQQNSLGQINIAQYIEKNKKLEPGSSSHMKIEEAIPDV